VPRNGFLSTDLTISGTIVSAECNPGYTFPGFEPVILVECIDEGGNLLANESFFWNTSVSNCHGE